MLGVESVQMEKRDAIITEERRRIDIANTAVNHDATVKGFWATDGLQTRSANCNSLI